MRRPIALLLRLTHAVGDRDIEGTPRFFVYAERSHRRSGAHIVRDEHAHENSDKRGELRRKSMRRL